MRLIAFLIVLITAAVTFAQVPPPAPAPGSKLPPTCTEQTFFHDFQLNCWLDSTTVVFTAEYSVRVHTVNHSGMGGLYPVHVWAPSAQTNSWELVSQQVAPCGCCIDYRERSTVTVFVNSIDEAWFVHGAYNTQAYNFMEYIDGEIYTSLLIFP